MDAKQTHLGLVMDDGMHYTSKGFTNSFLFAYVCADDSAN
jgi:hypothetical protein